MQRLKERMWVLMENKNIKNNDAHHIYKNSGCYWINFTFHNIPRHQSKRFRFSLKTKDFEVAKKRRDKILNEIRIKYGTTC